MSMKVFPAKIHFPEEDRKQFLKQNVVEGE